MYDFREFIDVFDDPEVAESLHQESDDVLQHVVDTVQLVCDTLFHKTIEHSLILSAGNGARRLFRC